jgi:nucleoid-associated protein YgaU
VKIDLKILLIAALLLNGSPAAFAQDESLSEEDLKSLLEESPAEDPAVDVAKESPATDNPQPSVVADEAPAEAPVEEAAPATASAPVQEEPTDTVDLESLENNDEAVVENDAVEPSAPVEEKTAPEIVAKPTTPDAASDDLEALKTDLGDEEAPKIETVKKDEPAPTKGVVFDVGREERDLLAIAQTIQGQISDTEWNEVATAAKANSYTVVRDDWLFKISKRIFGSGFFYPKIWSMNTFIANPHYIEPGMILSFTTGSGSQAPEFKLGEFTANELQAVPGSAGNTNGGDLANFGDEARPAWLDEKKEMANQGIYFQYASDETMEDLTKVSEQALNREYENYEPPKRDFDIVTPSNYDKTGFDKNSRIFYSFKEGYYLSTFVSTNIVQDFGSITDGPDENIFFTKADHAYVKFDESINALAGDKFSVYSTGGKVEHKSSDRSGFKYTIVGQIKLLKKIRDKWEVEFIEVAGVPQRGDRITAYTPKIDRITRTYNSRLVEAGIVGSFENQQMLYGFGNVVYLDRGRADGVEMGNVFDVYGFKDRATNRRITDQPTYKTGELTVITLTDNFATAIVSKSIRDFYLGDVAITKTKEAHLREINARSARSMGEKELIGGKALEELDVELNLDNMNDDLLKEADKIQLTEDELAELERQEREKSVLKDSERDLKALERLENEIENAETILNDAKLDEDKLLEGENLNDLEKKSGATENDNLDEIEANLGKRYVDDDLNSKDNPFGLTEFDVEEVDELLNTEKKQSN